MAAPRVVIVGGGFGGLYAARALRRARVDVTVVDRTNHHVFQPLLYQVATAGLSPSQIAYPVRGVLRRQANTRVLMATVTGVDVAHRRVLLADGDLAYDFLILAPGARHSYFGHPEWEPLAPGLKTIDDALGVRARILSAFERAERERDPERRRALLTFVVVGGGPTGVELAGAIGEIACKVMARDFRTIDTRDTRTILVEAGPRILPAFPPGLAEKAERSLERLCVEVRAGEAVTRLEEGAVWLGADRIACATVLWAAGVAPSPIGRTLGVPLDRAGRVVVNADLSIPGHPEVFVIGDLAAASDERGRPLPGLAPVAIQEGEYAARVVAREAGGRGAAGSPPRAPFRYRDRGTMATIGRAAAVVDLGRLRLSGYPAWLLWCFIHILWLIGFRNRFVVMIEWAWAYLRFERSARLITGGAGSVRGEE
ncbi:MAG TPA: NAD(P)/FAD-dependent oxidoreductase [Gemmatimonadales bacterium]|nr:NAD(P)/FAD-dependent oxidoreductase [Gemmatimonadales bacterium]